MDSTISIVIRTYNSGKTLGKVLAALDCRPGDRLIIVDSGSTDRTLEISRQFNCEIIPITQNLFTYGRALNFGFKAATTEWVLALSSHCIPMVTDYLQTYRAAIVGFGPETVCAIAPMVYCDEDWTQREGVTLFSPLELEAMTQIPGGNTNALYRKSTWEERHFDESLTGAEDHEWILWSAKNEYSLAIIHGAPVLYAPTRPLLASFRKGIWDRANTMRLGKVETKTRHNPLQWTRQLLGKLLRGQIGFRLFLHIVAQRLGSFGYRLFKK